MLEYNKNFFLELLDHNFVNSELCSPSSSWREISKVLQTLYFFLQGHSLLLEKNSKNFYEYYNLESGYFCLDKFIFTLLNTSSVQSKVLDEDFSYFDRNLRFLINILVLQRRLELRSLDLDEVTKCFGKNSYSTYIVFKLLNDPQNSLISII